MKESFLSFCHFNITNSFDELFTRRQDRGDGVRSNLPTTVMVCLVCNFPVMEHDRTRPETPQSAPTRPSLGALCMQGLFRT